MLAIESRFRGLGDGTKRKEDISRKESFIVGRVLQLTGAERKNGKKLDRGESKGRAEASVG